MDGVRRECLTHVVGGADERLPRQVLGQLIEQSEDDCVFARTSQDRGAEMENDLPAQPPTSNRATEQQHGERPRPQVRTFSGVTHKALLELTWTER